VAACPIGVHAHNTSGDVYSRRGDGVRQNLAVNGMRSTAFVALLLAATLGPRDARAIDCGDVVTASVTLQGDLDCPNDGLVVGADAVVIDCAGHFIRTPDVGATTDIRIADRSGIEIRNCRLTGRLGIDADRVIGLVIVDNEFTELSQVAISAVDGANVTIEGNVFRGDLNWVSIARSPSTRIGRNRFEAGTRFSSIHTSGSPGARISDNTLLGGGFISVSDSEGARVERNAIRGTHSQIAALRATACRISDNRLEREHPGEDGSGSILLNDATRCEVSGNLLDAAGGFGLLVDGDSPERGANRIMQNEVRGGSFGVVLLGPRADRIEDNVFRGQSIGILAYPSWDAANGTWDDGSSAEILNNRVEDATMGVAAYEIGGLLFKGNLIRNGEVGIYELDITPPVAGPNRYERNRVERNRGFGMAILGTSPIVQANTFSGNGGATTLSDGVFPLAEYLGGTRAAIAIIPIAGFGNDTLDDGVADNDAVPAPSIGSASAPNVFRGNDSVDIYALDARPANASSLQSDNRFLGREARYRQDWYGLVRAVDEAGSPVAGAVVRVIDRDGTPVLDAVTGADGYAPLTVEPLRSQGLSDREPGGPVPHWPIFTEQIIDARGRVRTLTPHTIRATKDLTSGCAEYSWNGRDDPGESGNSALGRYQTALVRFGALCPPASLGTSRHWPLFRAPVGSAAGSAAAR